MTDGDDGSDFFDAGETGADDDSEEFFEMDREQRIEALEEPTTENHFSPDAWDIIAYAEMVRNQPPPSTTPLPPLPNLTTPRVAPPPSSIDVLFDGGLPRRGPSLRSQRSRADSPHVLINDDNNKKTYPEDQPLIALPPFSSGERFKLREDNPLIASFLKIDYLKDALKEAMPVKSLILDYCRRNHVDDAQLDPYNMGVFADRVVDVLKSTPQFATAYSLMHTVSTISQTTALLSAGGVAKSMMSKLEDEARIVSGSMSAVDKTQFVDAGIKLASGVYYQYLRTEAENSTVTTTFDDGIFDLARKKGRQMYALFQTNPYNAAYWRGFFLLDIAINVVSHFLSSGRPVGEAREIAGALGGTATTVLRHVGSLNLPGLSDIAKAIPASALEGTPAETPHHDKYHPPALLTIIGGLSSSVAVGLDALRIQDRMSIPDITYAAIGMAYRDLKREGVLK